MIRHAFTEIQRFGIITLRENSTFHRPWPVVHVQRKVLRKSGFSNTFRVDTRWPDRLLATNITLETCTIRTLLEYNNAGGGGERLRENAPVHQESSEKTRWAATSPQTRARRRSQLRGGGVYTDCLYARTRGAKPGGKTLLPVRLPLKNGNGGVPRLVFADIRIAYTTRSWDVKSVGSNRVHGYNSANVYRFHRRHY